MMRSKVEREKVRFVSDDGGGGQDDAAGLQPR
jgi:hypothetical protein